MTPAPITSITATASRSPGTIITFFPWPRAPRGRRGTGRVTAASFLIPSGAVDYWTERLNQHGISVRRNAPRFGEPVISFSDPDGLGLELIASDDAVAAGTYEGGEVPPAYAIRGFHSATLTEEAYQKTAALLNETMGFQLVGQEGNRYRYSVGSGQPAASVDVLCAPEQRLGSILTGTVHHIAWRTPDDASQNTWHQELMRLGYNVSPVMDRKYFHSIYYREPGGVLFEIATDPPGFAVDEAPDRLGTHLVLPAWLEASRAQLESVLPPLKLPGLAQPTL